MQNKKIQFIAVDLQHDFTAEGGSHYRRRPSVDFVKGILMPYLQEKNIRVSEIISDYRNEYNKRSNTTCVPGTWGYASEIPAKSRNKEVWIKCQNSPVWVTKNIGDAKKEPGKPFQNPKAFTQWLENNVGKPQDVGMVVLFGLTLDCCVFCTAQELRFRGYTVKILEEATDSYSGMKQEKQIIINNYPLLNWARGIKWKELQKILLQKILEVKIILESDIEK
ncbi:isochorismatase family protein [Candidatus Uhrbacteria bacterium]|nr:isochorismatase family protein [Candidatus Uhrbacteria bacterium]